MSYWWMCLIIVNTIIFQSSANSDITIINSENKNDGLGNSNYKYVLSDATTREESVKIVNKDTENEYPVIQGIYSFIQDAVEYRVRYIADINGFRPKVEMIVLLKDRIPTSAILTLILIILVIYYVIIMSTYSRNMNIDEKENINNRNSLKYLSKTRFNTTNEKSKNGTTSEERTHLELIGLQNKSKSSNDLSINQTSMIETKFTNGNENKTKECFELLNGRTYEKEFETGCNNTVQKSDNVIAAQNITYHKVTGLQNNSEKSTASNINQTKDKFTIIPILFSSHKNNFSEINPKIKIKPSIGSTTISTNVIISLMGPS